MKNVLTLAAIVALAAAFTPASAENADKHTVLKAPTKTMGDEGKLPATKNMSGAVPEMRGPRTAASPADPDASPESFSAKGPAKRMGDEGKLPATGNMGDAVPDMTGPDAPTK